MAARLVIIISLSVVVAAVPLINYEKLDYENDENDAPAHVEFSYSIHDSESGDIKQQKEARAGDVVRGSYSFVQPDGLQRIVEYTADKENGFNAIVRYQGTPITARERPKVVYPAPVVELEYAAPVAKDAYPVPFSQLTFSSPMIFYRH